MVVTATLSMGALTVTPGGETLAEVRLRNSTHLVDEFTFEVLGDSKGWTVVEPAVVELPPGAEAIARVRFLPPRSSAVPVGPMPFAIKAKSREEHTSLLLVEGVVVVAAFHDTSAELIPETGKGRMGAKLALENHGNTPVKAWLTAADPDRKLNFWIRPGGLAVEPGTVRFASIRMSPRRRFVTGPPKNHRYSVAVHQDGVPKITVSGSVRQDALITTSAGPVLIGVVTLLLVAATIAVTVVKNNITRPGRSLVAAESVVNPANAGSLAALVNTSPAAVVINQPAGVAAPPAIVTLWNNSDRFLLLRSISLAQGSTGDFSETNNCPDVMPPRTSCQIMVALNQVAVDDSKTRTDTLTINDGSGGALHSVPLTGIPAQSVASFTPQSLAFTQNLRSSGPSQRISLVNIGQAPLHPSAIHTEGDFSQTNNCAVMLAPGAGCVISVAFTPTGPGERLGYVVVADDSADSPHRIPITGTSTIAVARLGPGRLTFGQNVGATSAQQTVTLTSTGDGPLHIANIAVTGEFKVLSDCPSVLLPGLSCPIGVAFAPQGSGSRHGSLIVTSDAHAARGSQDTVRLDGVGHQPIATFDAAVLAPTATLRGLPVTQAVTVTNTGDGALTVRAIAIDGVAANDYRQSSDCVRTLQPGATCTIAVTFTPQDYGVRAASLTLYDDGAGGSQSIALRGTGRRLSG
jgi:hypothetical protein